MRLIFGLFLVALAGLAQAGSSGVAVVFASGGNSRVAATLRQRADFIAIPISLRSDKSDPAERIVAIGAAKSLLQAQVAKQSGWASYDGPLFLTGGSDSLIKSFSGSQSQADLAILVPLADSSDVFSLAASAIRFVNQQTLASKVEASIGRIGLAMRDAQQYRPQLLKLIAEDAARTRDAVALAAQITLEGLEGPVAVRQINDHDVELFINYRLSVEKR